MSEVTKSACGCVSRLRIASLGGDTNSICHGYIGGVQPNNRRRLRNPAVVLVLWDDFFATKPKAVAAAERLLTDLVAGPFMNGLVQYGIGDGSLLSTITLDPASHPAPATWDSGADDDKQQVYQWVKAATLSPKPAQDEANLIYLILLPTATALTNGKNKDGSPNTNVCGWHKHQKFNDSSGNDDLFWAVVRTDNADKSSEQDFVNSVAFCIGHELVEAFTNRDDGGFFASNGCEIGDICEAAPNTLFSYRDWSVQPYWSNWDSQCIHGDQAISMRKYLGLIGIDGKQGLRKLKSPLINRNAMAAAIP